MDCLCRRTLASVFLLSSLHSVRVLSQNVVPTGPLPPLPFMRDLTDPGFGSSPQQGNFMQPALGPPDFIPQAPCALPFQNIDPFQFGTNLRNGAPSLFSSVPNIGPIPQASVCNSNEPPLRPLPEPVCNSPPVNIPQQGPFFSFPPPIISLPPLQNLLQSNPPPISNIPPQGSINIPPVPLMPGPQGPPYSGPIPPGQTFLSNTESLPIPQLLFPPSYPQQCAAPTLNSQLPFSTPADLVTVPFLLPPNLPPAIPVPIQNYVPNSNQNVLPPQLIPLEYIPLTPQVSYPSNDFGIAALPPVFPVSKVPQYYEYNCGTPPNTEYNPVPINLEINVPSPTMPEPKITVITAFTSPPPIPPVVTPESADVPDVSFGFFPPPSLPPIIIENRRSKSRRWLPLILIALLARDGCGCGYGGCCPCNTDNADIPIPFPIPIPTNNAIILPPRCPCAQGSKVKVEKKD